MKHARAWLCLIIAAVLSTSFVGCGKEVTEETPTTTSTEAVSVPSDDADDDEEDEAGDDAPIDEESLIIKGKSTTAPSETVSTAESGAQTAATNDGTGTTKATGGAGKTTETKTAAGNAGNASDEEEKVVSGVINLSNGSFEGEGISVNGSTILITGEGTYVLSGSKTGMVEVNSDKKVKLKLNGVNIQNPSGPAILCTDAKKLTITLIEGTTNTLSDGANTAFDGAICSNDTLEIKGAGTLNVNANNEHGISSDDDLIIKNGTITVNAKKTGLMANDDITISGGTLRVTGATNGIKSKGTLHISGGTIWSIGGPKENKSALYSAGVFSLTGGYVYAIGCGASDPDSGTSTQRAISVKYVPSLAAGGTASLHCGGAQLMRESSPYAFNTIFVSTPDIRDGQAFSVYGNDVEYGSGFVTSGLLTAVSAEPTPATEPPPVVTEPPEPPTEEQPPTEPEEEQPQPQPEEPIEE